MSGMHKLASFALVAALALPACSKKDSTTDDPKQDTTQETTQETTQ